jgi:hypothetical protein
MAAHYSTHQLWDNLNGALATVSCGCATGEQMAEKGSGYGNLVSYGQNQSVSPRLMPNHATSLNYVIACRRKSCSGKAAFHSPNRKLGECSATLWSCGWVFSHLNFFEDSDHSIRLSVYILVDITSNSRLQSTSEDITLKNSLLLCSWTCSSSFCVITVSTVQL